MQKIKGRLKDNWLFALLVGLFILFLVPMVAMCFLAVPASDDFVNASIMRDLMENDSSLLTYFKNVFLQAKDLYDTIQGAFTIDVLIFLNPIAYNIGLYPVTCLLNFIVTLVCVLVLSRSIMKHVLHSTWKNTILLWMLFVFMVTQFVRVEETYYWYAGFVAYNFPFCLFMLFCAALIRIQFQKEKRLLFAVLACVLGFLVGGTNYPLSLFGCCAAALLLFVNLISRKRREALWQLPPVVFLVVGFLINVFAPGNSIRMGRYEQLHPVKAVFESFYSALDYLADWLTETPILFLLVLCIPFMAAAAGRMKFRFRLPGLLTVVLFCLYAALFTPGLFGMGSDYMPERYLNMVYGLLTWMLLGLCFYWTGWLVKRFAVVSLDKPIRFGVALLAAAVLLVPLSTRMVEDTVTDMGSLLAAEEIVMGPARAYHKEAMKVLDTLENSPEDTVVIPGSLPATDCLHELVLINGRWEVNGLKMFYHKEIICEE